MLCLWAMLFFALAQSVRISTDFESSAVTPTGEHLWTLPEALSKTICYYFPFSLYSSLLFLSFFCSSMADSSGKHGRDHPLVFPFSLNLLSSVVQTLNTFLPRCLKNEEKYIVCSFESSFQFLCIFHCLWK